MVNTFELSLRSETQPQLSNSQTTTASINESTRFLAMTHDEDDSVSIESNPFARPVLTEARLAHYEKIHRENPHPVYRGPPWVSPSPDPPAPKRKPRTSRLLDGIGPIQYLHGLERLPNGQVYSRRLEVQRLNKTAATPAARQAPPRHQPRRPPTPPPAASRPFKTGRVQKKAGTRQPRRKTRSAKRVT
jgi:hypothetical protein